MKFTSAIVSAASGSIGGGTYARNRGGLYIRARSIPVNTNTPEQQEVRAVFGSLAQKWSNVLNDSQREGWRVYAQDTPRTNWAGSTLVLSGQQMYIRCNSARLQIGELRIDNPPDTAGLATLSPITLGIVDDATTVNFTIVNTDAWATSVAGSLGIWMGRPQGPGINSFKGPWRFYGSVPGAVSPPSNSEAVGGSAFTSVVGQKVWFRFMATDAKGRLSQEQILGPATVVGS